MFAADQGLWECTVFVAILPRIFFKPSPQEDNSGELETVEVFKLEHYAAALRREYVESYESRDPPSVSRAQMKKSMTERGECSPLSLLFEACRWKITQLHLTRAMLTGNR